MRRTRDLLVLFGRAWLIVTLTALNVGLIARRAYPLAVCTGFGISFVWYTNTRKAIEDRSRAAQVAYSLGAATGTGTGMVLAAWLRP